MAFRWSGRITGGITSAGGRSICRWYIGIACSIFKAAVQQRQNLVDLMCALCSTLVVS